MASRDGEVLNGTGVLYGELLICGNFRVDIRVLTIKISTFISHTYRRAASQRVRAV
jgi:hypothetical protein